MPTYQPQLNELLTDRAVVHTISLVAKEFMPVLDATYDGARRYVLSAIAMPKALTDIYNAWLLAQTDGRHLGLLRVIIRRRVRDLLRKETRRTGHTSWPADDDGEVDSCWELDDLHANPEMQAHQAQLDTLVRHLVESFAAQSPTKQRQVELLRRYVCDDVPYEQLAAEMSVTQNALRSRVHKARCALRRHLRKHCPRLQDQLSISHTPG